MSSTAGRHVLVVASQCRTMPELTGLWKAACDLRDVFLDPDIGACEPGLPSNDALVFGELAATEIEAKVNESIDYASRNGATLVLALLGHGFIPGNDPSLYLMGRDSAEGIRDSAVDVGRLLLHAADRPGVNGVIGIIDTCAAAAAQPSVSALSTGTLGGQTRLSLLMASSADQPAYGMNLSLSLAGLLRAGAPKAGPYLFPTADVVAGPLRAAVPGQNLVIFSYDGDYSENPIWLARNRRPEIGGEPVGSYGTTELTAALSALFPDRVFPAVWDVSTLSELGRELSLMRASPARTRAARVIENLLVAQQTIAFLQSLMPTELSSQRLYRALAALASSAGSALGAAHGPEVSTEVDAVEYVALRYPRAEKSCRAQMARFVLELVNDAGLDPGRRELQEWAGSIDAIVAFNDARSDSGLRHAERRLRLIVSLHYSLTGDWPEALGAWLIYDNGFYGHKDFPCTPDQPGAEEALACAVDWAEEQALALEVSLRRIEVAAPVKMLLRWRPEEIEYGARLGVNYEVINRWSQRLDSRPVMRRINRNAGRRLAEIAACAKGTRMHWLSGQQVSELSRLSEDFRAGRHAGAVGLIEDPGENDELFQVILQFAPILVWPPAARVTMEHRRMVDSQWHLLPTGFLTAYRARWRAEDGGPMADMRAVWDDEEWLAFCGTLVIRPQAQTRSI